MQNRPLSLAPVVVAMVEVRAGVGRGVADPRQRFLLRGVALVLNGALLAHVEQVGLVHGHLAADLGVALRVCARLGHAAPQSLR